MTLTYLIVSSSNLRQFLIRIDRKDDPDNKKPFVVHVLVLPWSVGQFVDKKGSIADSLWTRKERFFSDADV